jgi:catechol 2,3-dioxygenase-like lactoylglutathione lyase family enzyme
VQSLVGQTQRLTFLRDRSKWRQADSLDTLVERRQGGGMSQISLMSLLVEDYDAALAFYVGKLGFQLVEDTDLGAGKRWVVVRPKDAAGSGLLLARAVGERQSARLGDQTGGRVFLFLQTEDFQRDFTAMTQAGVHFIETPRQEAYGTVAVFEDLYGNRWDLIEPKP